MAGALDVETFINRWSGREGGQERANYSGFLYELCDVLGVARPDPAEASHEHNDYVFERAVKDGARDGADTTKRIDLYKRNCFILEAKQSRQHKDNAKRVEGQTEMPFGIVTDQGKRSANRSWDVLMMNARVQAENYVRLLPTDHVPPPFVIVCDVGHCIEIYANFRRDGKAYDQFPDRQGFRVYMEDFRDEGVRKRLKAIWTEPDTLDPSRNAARVTRKIAERLAKVSKSLEDKGYAPDVVAMFLMRCLFTMFAQSVGLLPENCFHNLLKACEPEPATFPHEMELLWHAMDKGEYASAAKKKLKRFNGEFFKNPKAIPLDSSDIFELRHAAGHNWKEVEPAIFGTLVEQALSTSERKKLGAHYTPRAYVERLVHATIIDPLRADWAIVLATIHQKREAASKLLFRDDRRDKLDKDALALALRFHAKLAETRVLDPACGTGNFLYVAMELMKRLEGEVLDAIESLGGTEKAVWFDRQTVDPHQFLGMELNPRAAAIAELVLWIGYLQWFYRTYEGDPPEPILKAFHNIVVMNAVLTPALDKRPVWPEAEFIVGNPPFIGGKDVRARLGDADAEALWKTHKGLVNESADFVMYWWDRAAEMLTRKGTVLRRFGLVTTNSISQVFQRRVMERHLNAKKPVSLVMAIADHPWTKATKDSAAVRIAMTVAEAGKHEGVLYEVTAESGLETDAPHIELNATAGTIHSDLTIGVDVTKAKPLKANDGICSPGVKLHGAGFIVTPQHAKALGLGSVPGLAKHIRDYRNGRDLTARPRDVMVIDLFGLEADEVRQTFPAVYQHVAAEVKPDRQAAFDRSPTNDAKSYLENWWIFGKPRTELRPALANLPRYIATVETTKHRVFQFLDASILPDNMLVAIGTDDAFALGVLSARLHGVWALRAGGWLGMGNDPRYSKSRCFDPFPFPDATEPQKTTIRAIAEELDAHRKRVLAQHEHLTLTGLYNVLEELRAGTAPDALAAKSRKIFDDGLVLILKELHDRLDRAVFAAYGWPSDLTDDDILARLVALNAERAKEEARGHVLWLRPDYQIPRFGSVKEKAQLELVGGSSKADAAAPAGPKPSFPENDVAQTAAVMATLARAAGPVSAAAIARHFKQGARVQTKVQDVLNANWRMAYVTSNDNGETFSIGWVA